VTSVFSQSTYAASPSPDGAAAGGEVLDARAHDGDARRRRGESVDLAREAARQRHIVGVHARDDAAARRRHAHRERARDAAPLAAHEAHARVA
jgi:hypothetical protein